MDQTTIQLLNTPTHGLAELAEHLSNTMIVPSIDRIIIHAEQVAQACVFRTAFVQSYCWSVERMPELPREDRIRNAWKDATNTLNTVRVRLGFIGRVDSDPPAFINDIIPELMECIRAQNTQADQGKPVSGSEDRVPGGSAD